MLLMYGSCRCRAARLISSPLAARELLLPAEVAVIVPYGDASLSTSFNGYQLTVRRGKIQTNGKEKGDKSMAAQYSIFQVKN